MPYQRKHVGLLLALLVPCLTAASAHGGEPPPCLPRYDLEMRLDVDGHQALVRQRVTWTNYHQRPATELVFNAHSHYKLPDKDVGFLAKMLEILRLNPSEALDFVGHELEVKKVTLAAPGPPAMAPRPVAAAPIDLPFHYQEDNDTALVVPLPHPVGPGETVAVEIDFIMHLPPKQGRWGQWKGVTFLSNWLPVLAFYDDKGWQPTPFIVWHQPFFNEAGVYHARVTLPCEQKFASTGSVVAARDLGDGWRQVDIYACAARDFAFLCSARFVEFTGLAGNVLVRCLALPEHEYYARRMVDSACYAIPAYCQWFGPYPYPEFNIVESYFGWNGNECSGLIMIDERVFAFPHVAHKYVDYLISHETCHQWWYNVVGTNGYCETWMDEGLATYLSYKLVEGKCGKHDKLLDFPSYLEWLPNIPVDTYRNYGLYGAIGRGEACATVQELPKFGHLVDLMAMTYDRGSRIVGMIEDRLGEAAFFDFMRHVYRRYYFRILRVADFQHELEAYTGRSWEQFFKDWLYGAGMTDWCVEKVKVVRSPAPVAEAPLPKAKGFGPKAADHGPCHVTVLLRQKGDINEETCLGFCLDGGEGFQLRIPILPQAGVLETDNPPARVEPLPDRRVRVEVELPCEPTQIAVDPDQVLVDREPANNYWKPRVRLKIAPLYTQLEETDLTTDYDRWNVVFGPWVYGAAYEDPWYTRSNMAGVRLGVYRTQQFAAGTYLAYRTDYRDFAAGVDALWDHWPWAHTQVGFNAEYSLSADWQGQHNDRGYFFGRYIFGYGDSLYLPPIHYLEGFTSILESPLPLPRQTVPGAERFDHDTIAGLHYHIDYLTPYWDPEGGFRFDATVADGIPIFGEREGFERADAQFAMVKCVPDGLGWLSETRVAARVYGGVALPRQGEFFTLGGSQLFRGFDLEQRQGSLVWVGSLEWRVPLARGLTWDCCDHFAGLRNIYGAVFYDVGDVYLNGHSVGGGVAHAVGAGLRFDVAWFSLVERTILRIDVAQAINANTGVQVWLGIQHPF
jgi:hypothetical protein